MPHRLATPSELVVQRVADGLRLSWRAVATATGYRIVVQDGSGRELERVTVAVPELLVPWAPRSGAELRVVLVAVRELEQSAAIRTSFHHAPLAPPARPRVVDEGEWLRVGWNSVASAEGYELQVERDGEPVVRPPPMRLEGTEARVDASSLARAEVHTLRVRAVCGCQKGRWSPPAELVVHGGDLPQAVASRLRHGGPEAAARELRARFPRLDPETLAAIVLDTFGEPGAEPLARQLLGAGVGHEDARAVLRKRYHQAPAARIDEILRAVGSSPGPLPDPTRGARSHASPGQTR